MSVLAASVAVVTTSIGTTESGETYVYGVVEQLGETTLLFAPENFARAWIAEAEAWRSVTTWGEALNLARTDLITPPPIAVEDLDDYADEHEPHEPFRADETGAAHDGDWPVSIQTAMLDWLAQIDDESGVGTQQEAFPSSPWLIVDASEEDALVAALTAAGHPVRRDVDLMQQLAAK